MSGSYGSGWNPFIKMFGLESNFKASIMLARPVRFLKPDRSGEYY
jgi:hypothetical protein